MYIYLYLYLFHEPQEDDLVHLRLLQAEAVF